MKKSRVETNLDRCLARVSGLLAAVTFAAACVSTTPPEGANDPSSAQAESAPAPEASPVLDEGHAPLPEANGATPPQAGDDHSAHEHASHASGGGAAPSREHAAQEQSKQRAAMYVCPMHPEVRQGEPGRCPKCGMPLELEKPKTENQ